MATSTLKRPLGPKKNEYALYRGDHFIGMGTYDELSKISGLSVSTLQKINGNFYKKQCDNHNTPYEKRIFLVHVGDTHDCYSTVTSEELVQKEV